MSEITNGTIYRSLINNEEIKYEKSVSFEPDEIKITILTNEKVYQDWLKQKGEIVNFKMTNTNIDLTQIISHVILVVKPEEAVEVFIKLQSPEKMKEHKNMFR